MIYDDEKNRCSQCGKSFLFMKLQKVNDQWVCIRCLNPENMIDMRRRLR